MSNATPALTLAHLAPYLPYGIKIQRTLEGISGQRHLLCSVLDIFLNGEYSEFKPILRPMTDLTKQIHHGGRAFIPAKVLWNVSAKQEDLFDIYGTIPDYWKSCMGEHPFSHEYRTVRRLFEWHFDVFGLIDQGLAISYKEAGL